MPQENRLPVAHIAVALSAFGLGAVMAVMQSLARADLPVVFNSPKIYYLSVTAHGVLMALVFTTFFIMALGYAFARAALGEIVGEGAAWFAFCLGLFGTLVTTVAILSGSSTVLYTFYPPLEAHPAFYIGATLLIVASWIWCGVMIASAVRYRRENPQRALPLAVHGILATVVVWILATAGLAAEVLGMLIPWSLGWVERIDPVLARMYFWWFGHPLTYFWLIPAYVIWYTILPRVAGGRLFSDRLGRVVFVLFILFSTPVGLHHQFTDPGVSAGWKLVHTFTTYAILFPSLVTAFTITASLEVAGRMRGARGWFDWIGRLPWGEPLVLSVVLAMLTFAVGGFGGAINAAFAMNTMVHNTSWIMGHFHLTVGTAVTLTFMGATYWLLPRLIGRRLRWRRAALWQAVLWFLGMILFGGINHITGLQGMPRRVFSASYQGAAAAQAWQPWTLWTAVGGVVLFVSSALFLAVVVRTVLARVDSEPLRLEFAESLEGDPGPPGIWDRIGVWALVAAVLVAVAYGPPILHLISLDRFGSLPVAPF